MKNLLISLMTVGLVSGAVYGSTSAFFSDTETSTGNVLAAGDIDLKVGSIYSSQNNGGDEIALSDLSNQEALFNFDDLKPGDMGGGRFEIKVTSNDSWACIESNTTEKAENGVIDPEVEASDTPDNGPQDGELQDYLRFVFWNDVDGDGVMDLSDANLPTTSFTLAELDALGSFPLADATGLLGPSFLSGSPLPAGSSHYLGFAYCFGNFGPDFTTCDGVGSYNKSQTDTVKGNLIFSAIQSRNNMDYVCNPSLVPVQEQSTE